MKTAVFGTGVVGQTIAAKLISLGHEVTIGTRDVAKTLSRKEKDRYGNLGFGDWYEANKGRLNIGTFADAAGRSEMIFNCTMGLASLDVMKEAGKQNIKGKILVDVANPLDFSRGMPPILNPVNTDSLGELLQRMFPDVYVVKTLNTMNCYLMVDPASVHGDHNVFMSGNDQHAKDRVRDLLMSFGWRENNIIDLGDITTARGTEQLLPIWVRLYGKFGNANFNFHIVRG